MKYTLTLGNKTINDAMNAMDLTEKGKKGYITDSVILNFDTEPKNIDWNKVAKLLEKQYILFFVSTHVIPYKYGIDIIEEIEEIIWKNNKYSQVSDGDKIISIG